jgi:Chaperone of endosialidase
VVTSRATTTLLLGILRSFNNNGVNNTAVGYGALIGNTSGSSNVALGVSSGTNVTDADSVICIGASGQNVSNSCYIGQIFGATSASGTAVFINSDGKLGTITSSRRFKEEIQPLGKSSEALFALDPATFRYRKEIDPTGMSQFGLIAEDVE